MRKCFLLQFRCAGVTHWTPVDWRIMPDIGEARQRLAMARKLHPGCAYRIRPFNAPVRERR